MVVPVNFQAVENIISDEREAIGNVRAFLCDCYVHQGGWEILGHNPSKIHVQTINNIKQLVDDYDYVSKWFSLNYHHQLIACARLCGEDENGLLEIERYLSAKQHLDFLFNRKRELNIIELNREAVHPLYIKNEIFFLLLNSIFTYCIENKHSILTTTNLKEWIEIYQLIGLPELKDKSFKYHDTEAEPVKVYFADQSAIVKITARLQVYLEKGDKYAFKTSCVSLSE